MNNFQLLLQITRKDIGAVAAATNLSIEELTVFGKGKQELSVSALEKLCLYFSAVLDQMGQKNQQNPHPIHLRLSVDYLLNLGMTLSDLIALKWGLEGNWSGDSLAVGFFQDDGRLVRVIEDTADFTAAFAGYLILALEGEFTPYVDEIHDNVRYDWRLLRYHGLNDFQDITNALALTPFKEIKP